MPSRKKKGGGYKSAGGGGQHQETGGGVEPHQPKESQEEKPTSGVKALAPTAEAIPRQQPSKKEEAKAPVASSQDIVEQIQELDLSDADAEVVRRPGYGKAGRPIGLEANYFRINASKGLIVFQYRVDISQGAGPPKKNRDELRQIFIACIRQNPTVFPKPFELLYDSANIAYSLSRLSLPGGKNSYTFEDVELTLVPDNRQIKASLKIQYADGVHVDLTKSFTSLVTPSADKQSTPLQVLDQLFRQARSQPENTEFYPWGRSVFLVPGEGSNPPAFQLGKGREMWTGAFSAVKICQGDTPGSWKPMLNMDLAFTVFYKTMSSVDFMCHVLNLFDEDSGGGARGGGRGGRGGGAPGPSHSPRLRVPTAPLNPSQFRTFNSEIKGLRVKVTHRGVQLVYRVVKAMDSANKLDFEYTPDGGAARKLTVARYFSEIRQQPLRFPHLPCLWVGSDKKATYLPLEVCELRPLQKCNKTLEEFQTAAMIRETALPAAERRRQTLQMIQKAFGAPDSFLKTFGASVDLKMVQFQGRVIQAPKVNFARDQTVVPKDGVWNADRQTLSHPGSLSSIGVINLHQYRRPNDSNQAEEFFFALMRMCQQMGMKMGGNVLNEPSWFHNLRDVSELENCLKQSSSVDLALIILSSKNTQYYSEVKRVGDVALGTMTQCVLWKNVERLSPATLQNIVLKINIKCKGINSGLVPDIHGEQFVTMTKPLSSGKKCPILFLGIDVTHPGKMETLMPSIGAIVGNVNGSGSGPTRYEASIKIQKQRREHIVYVQEAVKDRLMRYYECNKLPPQKIIVYRDGVSDGQFLHVLKEEFSGVQRACQLMSPEYRPQITYIVVQKRHHTRLYPQNERDGVGRSGNVPAGTTVDTTVTHPYEFDFFLCSHQGIQGTSKPAHYYVLKDQSRFSPDQLQSITYQLCHVYARCTRAVSIPAPVYYADLCCTRARNHLLPLLGSDSSSSGRTGSTSMSEASLQAAVKIAESLEKDMYFI